MQYIVQDNTKLYFDYTMLDNNSRVVFFKYNSRKRLKKELRNVFNTNSIVIVENRLNKYNLKLTLIKKVSSFDYYEITTKNIYGGSVKTSNNSKGMKIKFNLNDMKGSEEDA